MENLFKYIQLAIGFFTRIPLTRNTHEDGDLADAALAFPIVGFLIGALVASVWLAASFLLPPFPAAGIAVVFGMVLTGALHEDGLSDCADALGGTASKERALEIMRDSRIGTYGAAALLTSVGLRWTAIAELSIWHGFTALIIAHMTGRTAITIALRFSSYVRKEGLGEVVAKGVSNKTFVIIITATFLIALLMGGWQGLIAAALGFAAAILVLLWLEKRLGGYTGDGLGAMEQLAEITVLLTICGLLA